MADAVTRPNILFFHVDNLGLGELGCYGGGILRGADTARTDRFAGEGLQLWRGTPGAFEGTYFTASEGGLRTP